MRTDSELRQDVIAELNAEPSIRNEDVAIAVRDGVVTLAGTIDSYAQRYAAEQAVERVKGAKAIVNDLEVKLPSVTERSDSDIAHAALNALRWDVEVPEDRIRVKVENGWVTLEGSVEWAYQRSAAERTARYLTGVRGISNAITVDAGPIPSDVRKSIQDTFKRHAEIDASRITLETANHTVILRGTVRSLAEKRDAEQASWSCRGVTRVDNHLEVEPFAQVLT